MEKYLNELLCSRTVRYTISTAKKQLFGRKVNKQNVRYKYLFNSEFMMET